MISPMFTKSPRLPETDYFMRQATGASGRGTCDRLAVGAVLVKDGIPLPTGYNGSPRKHRHCDTPACPVCEEPKPLESPLGAPRGSSEPPCRVCGSTETPAPHRMHKVYDPDGKQRSEHCTLTVHAERNALLNAARGSGGVEGATLYVTDSPCWECAKDLVNAGVKRVVFQRLYQKREALWMMSRHMEELIQWRDLGPFTTEDQRTRYVISPLTKPIPKRVPLVQLSTLLTDDSWSFKTSTRRGDMEYFMFTETAWVEVLDHMGHWVVTLPISHAWERHAPKRLDLLTLPYREGKNQVPLPSPHAPNVFLDKFTGKGKSDRPVYIEFAYDGSTPVSWTDSRHSIP